MTGKKSFSLGASRDSKQANEVPIEEFRSKHGSSYSGIGNGAISADDDESSDTDTKKTTKTEVVGFLEVFKFASTKDRLLMVVGTVMASLHGAAMPVLMVIFGEMTDVFIYRAQYENFVSAIYPNLSLIFPNLTEQHLLDNPEFFHQIAKNLNLTNDLLDKMFEHAAADLFHEMGFFALYYAIVGVIVLIVGYLQLVCWKKASFNQCQRIRSSLLRSILKQHIGWFDVHEAGELNSRLSEDVNVIEQGIGDVLSIGIQFAAAFPAGLIIGLIYGWESALFILACSPLLGAITMFTSKASTSMTNKELTAYAKAGAVAQEVLGAIRTVVAFGGQEKETARYSSNLDEALELGKKKGMMIGSGLGLTYGVIFALYGSGFLLATHLMLRASGTITPGGMMIAFFAMVQGLFSIGFAAPKFQEFSKSRGAAHAIFSLIDMTSDIDSSVETGKRLENVKGNLEFRNVEFAYPSRPDVTIFQDVSLKINTGQTVALVGMSGSGKSTTVQLLQRFYDPLKGQVLLDGVDIKDFNVRWLRRQMGVVSQEPVLFGSSIAENIRFGKAGATEEEIVNAAKQANAHNFIKQLPEQYNTMVGERGAQLSGGQKQRIAIARALVRDPKILLLDEATSALDGESETIVQEALDKAREGRTTLVIAHRLSTIRTADTIIGMQDGAVVEQGTHAELMKVEGVYHTLVMNQSKKKEKKDEEDEFIDIDIAEDKNDEMNTKAMKRQLSQTSDDGKTPQEKEKEPEEEDLPEVDFRRIMRLNASEWPWILIGCLCAIIAGVMNPVSSIIFAELFASFAELTGDEIWGKVVPVSIAFIILGVVMGVGIFGQNACFYRSGEYLTKRVRQMVFKSYMRQDIAYFDDHLNGTGALCSRLATDASSIQGATGFRLGTMFQSVASMGGGLVLGFVYSWKLTLLILAFVPGLILAGFVMMRLATGIQGKNKAAVDQASKIAMEAIGNMRTVATLTREEGTCNDYFAIMDPLFVEKHRKTHAQGIGYSLSQALIFFANAAGFYLGGYLVQEHGLEFDKMFLVFTAIAFGAMSAGEMNSFAPNYGSAKSSASRVFSLFDRVPEIDATSEEGDKKEHFSGSISLNDVHFNYPTRPDVPVLKGINIGVEPGQTVALVGSSGCGKSTIVQLLERFYNPLKGSLCVDGTDIKQLNLQWLRREIGIVSQEPVLFDCSIRDNIAYGDNSRDVPMGEIIEAARKANIHSFIEALPHGYDTNVGDKGAQLSGGQKQRVAIARALVRNPKILLLDEATSALDTESEKVVQEALDKAQEGRTSIVIAHRLSTVQNADVILVLHQGLVAEAGTHNQLLARQGIYYKLTKAQAHAH